MSDTATTPVVQDERRGKSLGSKAARDAGRLARVEKCAIPVGSVFAKLTVIERTAGIGRTLYRVKCVCGKERTAEGYKLRAGLVQGCKKNGCAKIKHGCSTIQTAEYRAWVCMLSRCYRTTTRRYARYGGRGIAVCDRWKTNFSNFLLDMGLKPTPKHSLDRINNDGNYEPGNCRWATNLVQCANTSRNRYLEFNGERLPISWWARKLGVREGMIHYRLSKGWSVERALTEPLNRKASHGS